MQKRRARPPAIAPWPLLLGCVSAAAYAVAPITASELNQAHHDFLLGDFPSVLTILGSHDGQRPRRLSVEFMLAVSLCRVGNTKEGFDRLARLQTDFLVTQAKSKDIAAQLADCGQHSLPVAGLDGKADRFAAARVSVAAPAESAQPQMSGLERGWSYNQADIYSRHVSSATDCSNICLADGRCRAMTYVQSQRICWIKNRVPVDKAMSPDMTSAMKLFD